MHEWKYDLKERPRLIVVEDDLVYDKPEPIENLITWVYQEGSFVPSAKIIGEEKFSIINDYIGRPVQVYNEKGDVVWETDYDIYGGLKDLKGDREFLPFRQLGQYEDVETGLYFNRFRYYDCKSGIYISQDRIRLAGGIALYSFVHDSNYWVDIFGLTGTYIFTDGTTSYIGKGPIDRMNTSMTQRIGGKSNATASTHVDFGSDDMGFMVEHKLMEDYDARYADDFANSDRLNSPGKKKYDAADAKTKAKVDAEAAKIKADFEGKKIKCH